MSAAATARLFVALDPPLEVCEELVGWTRLAASALEGAPRSRRGSEGRPAVRLLQIDSMHLTLCFLGSRPVGEIDVLADVLGCSLAPVEELSVGAPVLLPPRRPSVLAVEIQDDAGQLARLQARVHAAISGAIAWQGDERRSFRAHITTARMREGVLWGQAPPPTPALRFVPEAIGLYRSWLAPLGASYEALARYELPVDPG